MFSICACSTKTKVPDFSNANYEDAKNILSTMGLIPIIEYEYSDDVDKDIVIRTEPTTDSKVENNSKVTVYVSKGQSVITSKEAVLTWYNIGNGQDDWKFDTPYIEDNILHIDCNVKFSKVMKWKSTDGICGFGKASINDSFDKVVPIKIAYDSQSWTTSEYTHFSLEISLADLGVDKPTDLYCDLIADNNGIDNHVRAGFSISW